MSQSKLRLTALAIWTAALLAPLPALADGPVRNAVVRNLARYGVSPGSIPATTRKYIWRMDNMHPKNGPPAPSSTSTYGFSVKKTGQIPAGKSTGETKPITRNVYFSINNGKLRSTARTTHTNTHYWRSENPGELVIDYTLKPNHRSRFVSLARQNGVQVAQGDAIRTQVSIENGKWASTAYLLNDRGVLFVSAKKPANVDGWVVKPLPGSKQQRWMRVRAPNE